MHHLPEAGRCAEHPEVAVGHMVSVEANEIVVAVVCCIDTAQAQELVLVCRVAKRFPVCPESRSDFPPQRRLVGAHSVHLCRRAHFGVAWIWVVEQKG